MLNLAIRARIPVIRADTNDLLNLPHVLKYLAPGMEIVEAQAGKLPLKGELLFAVDELTLDRQVFDQLHEQGRTLLLINQGKDSPFAFYVGEVPVPKALMENLLERVVPSKKIPELMPCFNGLTLKAMAEVIRLTTAKDKSLTAKGVTQVRAMITGKQAGLAQVDTHLPLYLCPPELKLWVDKNKKYFLEARDERLVPRGILLNGEPGVGKSQGAKYIATEFGVPLYRLDMATALSKWVSESEANFSRVLAALDQEEPAVLLIDEAEKQFAETQDEGITARLLSQLLWWLQERRSRVLVVLTTNNVQALPKELYRAGRINKVLTINKLTLKQSMVLALATLEQFVHIKESHRKELAKAIKEKQGTELLSHAEVVDTVLDLIKDKAWVS